MAKLLWSEDKEPFNISHPGCIFGVFHQFWHSKNNKSYKKITDDQDPFEVLKLFDKRASSKQKKSLKARIKAFVLEENYTEKDSDSVPNPKLQRTYSIHHLETNKWVDDKECFKTDSNEINDSRDVLEMFEVEKKIAKLTKSGSFPLKLKDKINEFYTISKAEKRLGSGKNSKEVTLRRSVSLKLKNENENVLNEAEPGFFRDTYLRRSYSQKERNPVSLLLSTDKSIELNNAQDCELLNEVRDKSGHTSENEESPKAKFTAFSEDSNGLTSENDPPELYISQGFQGNFETEFKFSSSKKHMESSTKSYYQDDDFTYVKQILEMSGFMKNGFQQTWYSSNQPLDPFVFQEIESQYSHNPALFADEVTELSHRLLIFDLVNDVLATMYARLLTYYPKSLSYFGQIRCAPTGLRVLDEVWKRVSRLVNLKPDMCEPVDHIVARDLGNDDIWMNLELDSECVALDLEDLILDEVLEEMLFECC